MMIMVTEVDLLAMIVTTELKETTLHETCLQTMAPPTGAEVHLVTTSQFGKVADLTGVDTAVEDSTVEASETTEEEVVSVVMAVRETRRRKESSKSAFASTVSSRDTLPEIAPRTEIEAVQEDTHLQVVI